MSTPEERLMQALERPAMATITDPTGDPPPIEMHRAEMGITLQQLIDLESGVADTLVVTRTMAPALIAALQAWYRETN